MSKHTYHIHTMKPWVEKYRPTTISDITHQDEITSVMKNAIETGNLPHLIFHGTPGTGKTSTIHTFTRMVYPKNKKDYVLELNASDDRCIDTVRLKIKEFSKRVVGHNTKCKFKLVILDEADTMTPDAQSALRRIMEDYSSVTRFCLICNYISKLMSPLLSRCSMFRFKSIPVSEMAARLGTIASCENICIRDDILSYISELSKGDMRRGIFNLQMVSTMNFEEEVTTDMVRAVCGEIDRDIVTRLWGVVRMNTFRDAKKYSADFISSGFPLSTLLGEVTSHVIRNGDISCSSKSIICKKIAEVEHNLISGCGEYLQLLTMVGTLMDNI